MKDLLTFIVKGIIGKDNFEIAEETEGERTHFLVKAPEDSVGIIIGKEGKTIKAIRSLLKVRATLEKKGVGVLVEGALPDRGSLGGEGGKGGKGKTRKGIK
ncbi:KH domain-containing protein [Candidatus Woesebacteria bacterium]|nr:KH domain-containing protein [Candidatus Woesebacteria bacterium]